MKHFKVLIVLFVLISISCKNSSSVNLHIDPQVIDEYDEIYNLFTEIHNKYTLSPELFDEIHEEVIPYPSTYTDYKKPSPQIIRGLLKNLFSEEQYGTLIKAHADHLNTPMGFYTAITTALSTLVEEDKDPMEHYEEAFSILLGSSELSKKLIQEDMLDLYLQNLSVAMFKAQLMSGGFQMPNEEDSEDLELEIIEE